MRRVVIVDDESLVRVGLQSLFDWESFGYKIVGIYQNGVEALEAIKNCLPDVLLTDIRMPDMDGLQLIEEVKKIDPDMNVVILSSYNDFEYMRKAIQYGVNDYVLKYKIEQEDLLKVLNSLKYSKKSSLENNTDPLNAEKDSLLKVLTGESGSNMDIAADSPEFGSLKSILNSHGSEGKWIVMKESEEDSGFHLSRRKALALLVEETFKRLNISEFIGSDDLYINGVICIRESLAEDEARKTVSGILSDIIQSARDKLDIDLKAGVSISGKMGKIEDFMELRKSAVSALQNSFYYEGPIYYDRPEFSPYSITENDWCNYIKIIKEFIDGGDLDSLYNWLSEISKRGDCRIEPKEVVRIHRYCIHNLIDHLVDRSKDELSSIGQSLEYLWSLIDRLDKVQKHQAVMEITDNIFKEIKQIMGDNRTSSCIQTAKKYVMENYGQNIYLEDAARMVNFSVNYFSQRFKQETKISFSEYLTNVRIQKAVEMLKKTELSTEVIASRVGYNNPNYFVKVFKKTTGKTISDFKRNLNN